MTSSELTPLGASLCMALDGRWGHVRQNARTRLNLEDFTSPPDLDREAHRARIYDQMKTLAGSGQPRDGFPVEYGGKNDAGASVTGFEMLAHGDLSLLVKAGVHWGLFAEPSPTWAPRSTTTAIWPMSSPSPFPAASR